ncbi:MAG: oligosaccharide flippase family protein, partial [Trueperaceae bacterium]|nr:oligosaccharide flippase family protein [Trueperaceae bacterium]
NAAGNLYMTIAALVLAALFGPTYVGWYLLAHRVLVLPVNLLSGSFKEAFLARTRTAQRTGGDLFALYVRATLGLAAVVAVPFLLVIAFGPPLFALVLGAEWEASGRYARWLALGLFVGAVNPPAIVITQVLRKQRWLMVYDALLLVARVAALVVVGSTVGDLAAVAAYALVGAAFNLLLVLTMGGYARRAPHAHAGSPAG